MSSTCAYVGYGFTLMPFCKFLLEILRNKQAELSEIALEYLDTNFSLCNVVSGSPDIILLTGLSYC